MCSQSGTVGSSGVRHAGIGSCLRRSGIGQRRAGSPLRRSRRAAGSGRISHAGVGGCLRRSGICQRRVGGPLRRACGSQRRTGGSLCSQSGTVGSSGIGHAGIGGRLRRRRIGQRRAGGTLRCCGIGYRRIGGALGRRSVGQRRVGSGLCNRDLTERCCRRRCGACGGRLRIVGRSLGNKRIAQCQVRCRLRLLGRRADGEQLAAGDGIGRRRRNDTVPKVDQAPSLACRADREDIRQSAIIAYRTDRDRIEPSGTCRGTDSDRGLTRRCCTGAQSSRIAAICRGVITDSGIKRSRIRSCGCRLPQQRVATAIRQHRRLDREPGLEIADRAAEQRACGALVGQRRRLSRNRRAQSNRGAGDRTQQRQTLRTSHKSMQVRHTSPLYNGTRKLWLLPNSMRR